MHIQDELNQARKRISEINSNFIQEIEKKSSIFQDSGKRKIEDAESALELYSSLNVDFSKIKDYDNNDSDRAQQNLKQIKQTIGSAPKEMLSKTREQMEIDEILSYAQQVNNPFYKRFFINSAIAGLEKVFVNHIPNGRLESTEGNCGDITYGAGSPNVMMPWCSAIGSNCIGHAPKTPSHVFGCIDQISVVCSLWFLIPSENIPQFGTLTVSPYFDIHGFFWDRANMTYGIAKEAAIKFRMQTILHHLSGGPPTYAFWDVLGLDGHNIDQSGRIDFTGYNQAAQGSIQVAADESMLVQVVAELDAYVQGAGSMALLNFQGEGNAIRIRNLSCVLNTQPVNYP